ncbi:MAG: hypothetical protein ACYDHZ_00470 [Dehalococcoidia bacterium]
MKRLSILLIAALILFQGISVWAQPSPTGIPRNFSGQTAKTSPTGADIIPIDDSAASYTLKKLTLTALATWLTGSTGSALALQSSTPGTQQTGNLNISGVGIFGTGITGTLTGNCSGTSANVTGTVLATHGGTGQTSYAVGDILYAPTTTTIGSIVDVTAGQPLLSGGAATAPAYAGYYFSGTAAQTYTLPTTSKTLMATDYSNAGTASGLTVAGQLAVGPVAFTPPTGVPLTVGETVTSSPRGIMSWQASNDATSGARLHLRKDRGTVVGTPAAVLTGDNLGRLVSSGYVGTNNGYLEMASILFSAEGTVSDGAGVGRLPTNIQFYTATDAAPSVLTERMRINSAGNVGIGTTNPGAKLEIAGTGTQQIRISASQDLANYYTILENNYNAANPFNIKFGTFTVFSVKASGNESYLDANNSTASFAGLKVGGATHLTVDYAGTTALGAYAGTNANAGPANGLIVSGNVGIGTITFGTSAAKVLGIGVGTAPSTAPAAMAQLWTGLLNGAGTTGFRFMNEGATTVFTLTGTSGTQVSSTGVGSILMASATVGPTSNTGWLTMLGPLGTPVYVPYWASATP